LVDAFPTNDSGSNIAVHLASWLQHGWVQEETAKPKAAPKKR
jgi:hypothetical protein